MRWLAVLLPLLFAGCGGGEPQSIPRVKSCLEGKGLQVLGGASKPAADDTDAPDRGELIAAGAFIAFYSSEELADKLATEIEANAKRIKATVERKGGVTVVFIDTQARDQIEACLDG